jgi:hypothetical protein
MNKQQINNNNNTRVTVAGDPAGVTRGLVIKYYNKSIIFPPTFLAEAGDPAIAPEV